MHAPKPDIQLIPLSDVELQEEADDRRLDRLIAALEKSKTLTEPPILAQGIGKKYMQLDGTNRISSLRKMKCDYVVAQVVNYLDDNQVYIKSWVHTSKVNEDDFLSKLKQIPGAETEEFKIGLGVTLTGHPMASATVIFKNGNGMSVFTDKGMIERVKLLNAVVDLYKKLIKRDTNLSIESMSDLSTFFTRHEKMNVGLFFPKFSSNDIYALMKAGITLPAGVTRHIINGRVIGLDYPIEKLKKDIPTKEKKKFFKDFIKSKKLRFYEESVYVAE